MRQTLGKWWRLFLICAVGLFLELAVIRWVAGEARLLAYFQKIPLLAAFLGLALGYRLAGSERDVRVRLWPNLALLVGLTLTLGRLSSQSVIAYPGGGDEFLWFAAPLQDWMSVAVFLAIVGLFFLCIVLLFIPLGQAAGKEMVKHPPVQAYIVNLLGSLTGIWLFAVVSYLRSGPTVWFAVAVIGAAVYFNSAGLLRRWHLGLAAVALLSIGLLNGGAVWSPYQRLEVEPEVYGTEAGERTAYRLNVQHTFYQYAFDLSPDAVRGSEQFEDIAFSYDLPYRVSARAEDVLIVGAGMGNDVAAALRSGASRIDAVEIDPVIQEFGQSLHPERPYDDARVNVIIDDARSFFRRRGERYDVVAFGLLDSHTLLSGLTSVRLDSFVYTVESFQEVHGHLREDGVAVLTFAVGAPWIEQRIGRMLAEVFGEENVYAHWGTWGLTFIAGHPSADRLSALGISAWRASDSDDVPLSTDDWPYLYMRTRKIPVAYWQALALIGLVAALFLRRTAGGRSPIRLPFWFLGAAFMLIEFKVITELALLFGTTWLVNALAITGVLSMSLAANLLVLRGIRIRPAIVFVLLLAALLVAWITPLRHLAALAPLPRAIASLLLLCGPLFFASFIFGTLLSRESEAASPLASDLNGAVVGGMMEYSSIMWGIGSAYPLAMLLYVGAVVTSSMRQRRQASPGLRMPRSTGSS